MKKIITLFAIFLMSVFSNTAFGGTGETSSGSIENTSSGSLEESIELNSATEEENEENINDIQIAEDQDKTIKELNSEVKRLNMEMVTNSIKANRLKEDTDLSVFFRGDLNQEELDNLRYLISLYNYHKNNLEKKLEEESEKLNQTEEIKQSLIDNKKEIYKKLIPYIKKENFNDYLEFIKNDVEIMKQNSEIIDDSIKKNIILKEKVDSIKEKIIEHKEELSKKLKEVIAQKIDEKISEFENSEKFQSLDEKQKEDLIKTLIYKTDQKIEDQKDIKDKTTLLVKKIEVYNILKEKFEELLLK